MAPEACIGPPLGRQQTSTVWVLRGTTWMAGRPPLEAGTGLALLRAHCDDPPPLRERANNVPDAIEALVMLPRKGAADRPEDGRMLAAEIRALVADGLDVPPTIVGFVRLAVWKRRRPPLLP